MDGEGYRHPHVRPVLGLRHRPARQRQTVRDRGTRKVHRPRRAAFPCLQPADAAADEPRRDGCPLGVQRVFPVHGLGSGAHAALRLVAEKQARFCRRLRQRVFGIRPGAVHGHDSGLPEPAAFPRMAQLLSSSRRSSPSHPCFLQTSRKRDAFRRGAARSRGRRS